MVAEKQDWDGDVEKLDAQSIEISAKLFLTNDNARMRPPKKRTRWEKKAQDHTLLTRKSVYGEKRLERNMLRCYQFILVGVGCINNCYFSSSQLQLLCPGTPWCFSW